MNDTLHRLHQTKKILAGLVLFVVGVALMTFGQFVPTVRELGWLVIVPWNELGVLLVGAGLLGIWLDSYFEREKQEADDERLDRMLTKHAPTIKDAVLRGFAFEDEDLRRVATPELLDGIIANSLAMRLGDREFARELYTDIRDQAVRSVERWHDVKISVRLSLFKRSADDTSSSPADDPSRLVVTIRHEHTTVPSGNVRRFVSLSDIDEYRDVTQDPTSTFAWYYRPGNGVDAGTTEAFELVQFTVDGDERPIRRTARKGAQTYTVNLGIPDDERHQERAISYTYRLIPAAHNRLLHFDIDQPSRGVDIELDYSDTDIAYVNMIDFIASSQKSVAIKSPDAVPGKMIGLQFEGWVMPKGGVAFVWVREGDLRAATQETLPPDGPAAEGYAEPHSQRRQTRLGR